MNSFIFQYHQIFQLIIYLKVRWYELVAFTDILIISFNLSNRHSWLLSPEWSISLSIAYQEIVDSGKVKIHLNKNVSKFRLKCFYVIKNRNTWWIWFFFILILADSNSFINCPTLSGHSCCPTWQATCLAIGKHPSFHTSPKSGKAPGSIYHFWWISKLTIVENFKLRY